VRLGKVRWLLHVRRLKEERNTVDSELDGGFRGVFAFFVLQVVLLNRIRNVALANEPLVVPDQVNVRVGRAKGVRGVCIKTNQGG
jgi:hypothetical protein